MENLIKDIYYQIKDLVRRVAYLEAHDGVSDLSSAMSFVQLTDTPDGYVGNANKLVAVNATADGLEFITGGGADTFLDLTDTPADYTGQANKLVAVNAGESALEFVAASAGVDTFLELTDTPASYPVNTAQVVTVNWAGSELEFSESLSVILGQMFLVRPADVDESTFFYITAESNSGTRGPVILMRNARGVFSAPTDIQDGDNLGTISFAGRKGVGYSGAAGISSWVDGSPGTYVPGMLRFDVKETGSSSSYLTAAVIRASGYVGIGTTDPEDLLHVDGPVALTDLVYFVDPTTPPVGVHKLYSRDDGIYVLDSDGIEVGPLGAGGSTLTVEEVDGTPSVGSVDTLVVPNGSLTDNGGGQVTLSISGSDSDAIHDNVSGEINAVTEKTTPANDDVLLIEDSAASYAKKRVKISNLPAGTPTFSGAIASLSTTYGVTSGGATAVWDTEIFDTDGYWSAGAPTRLTAPFTGYYRVSFRAHLEDSYDSGSGYMTAGLAISSSNTNVQVADTRVSQDTDNYGASLHGEGILKLDASDYVTLLVTHYNGTNNNLVGFGSSWMAIEYLGT